MEKRVLVVVADYPDGHGKSAMMFVHVRNQYYQTRGIRVTVLNFAAKKSYTLDHIRVIPLEQFRQEPEARYDVLICHAANLRNHYRFLRRYGKRFPQFIFFFHGHEIEKINEIYPRPYDYAAKHDGLKRTLQGAYDTFKLSVWRRYYPNVAEKSHFIFVSQSFHRVGMAYLRLTDKDLLGNVSIIYNSVGKIFQEQSYQPESEKPYDFITVRSNMDASNYCMDIVAGLAEKYPQYRFLVIGRGKCFQHWGKPDNLTWLEGTFAHEELVQKLNMAHIALMPTRSDTQGVMTCEMATFGIPVITSDIAICREIREGIPNIYLMDNDCETADLSLLYQTVRQANPVKKCEKYFAGETIEKEVQMILSL